MGQPIQSMIVSADNFLQTTQTHRQLRADVQTQEQSKPEVSCNRSSSFTQMLIAKVSNKSQDFKVKTVETELSSSNLLCLNLSDGQIKLNCHSRLDQDSLHRSSRHLDSILMSFNTLEDENVQMELDI